MKICLIDDDVVFCEALKKRLRQLDIDVTFFHNFSEEVLKKKYEIYIVDINLNWKSGVDIVEILKKEYKNINILIASGSINSETRQKIIDLWVRDFILKPFTGSQLKEKLLEIQARKISL